MRRVAFCYADTKLLTTCPHLRLQILFPCKIFMWKSFQIISNHTGTGFKEIYTGGWKIKRNFVNKYFSPKDVAMSQSVCFMGCLFIIIVFRLLKSWFILVGDAKSLKFKILGGGFGGLYLRIYIFFRSSWFYSVMHKILLICRMLNATVRFDLAFFSLLLT